MKQKRNAEAIIVHNAAFLFVMLFVLGVHVFVVESKPFVGFAALCVLVFGVPRIDPFVLWCLYSVVYWACDLPSEDNFLLLAATTLCFAAADLAEEWLPVSVLNAYRPHMTLALKLVAVLPVPCNNLLFFPGWGVARATLYLVALFARKRSVPSALFSKSEALVVLLCWHFAVMAAAARFRPMEAPASELLPSRAAVVIERAAGRV
jgi:hypothetical protein